MSYCYPALCPSLYARLSAEIGCGTEPLTDTGIVTTRTPGTYPRGDMDAPRIPFPRNGLISYHYFRNRDVSMCSPFTLIADSGAYSAKTQGAEIKLPDLCAWANNWREHFAWVAALDVIGDPVASRRNWGAMRRRGVNAVPTIHFPEPPSALDFFAKAGVTFIGLGGQVGGRSLSMLRWAISVMRYARDHWPEMKFHGWGTTSRLSLKLPYFSVDSTYWLQGTLWGKTTLHDPRSPLVTHRIRYDGRDAYRPEVANLLSTFYGTDPASVATSDHMNWEAIELQARSASVWESHLKAAHGVIAPPKELAGQSPGPRLHLVLPNYPPTAQRMAQVLGAEAVVRGSRLEENTFPA